MTGLAAAASLLPAMPLESLGWQAGGGLSSAWRLFSSHFVHLNSSHLLANGVALILLGWSCDRLGLGKDMPAAVLVSLLGVDLGLLRGPWPIHWYVGLSGLLHGLFAWMCLTLVLRRREAPGHAALVWLAASLFVLGLGKTLLGLDAPVGSTGWLGIPQATPAHLYGYLAGGFWGLIRGLLRPPR